MAISLKDHFAAKRRLNEEATTSTMPAGGSTAQTDEGRGGAPLATPKPIDLQAVRAAVSKGEAERTADHVHASGTRLRAVVDELNKCHFISIEGGAVGVFREGYDPERQCLRVEFITAAAFKLLHQAQTVTICNAAGNPVTIGIADAWLKHPERRQYLNGMALLPGEATPEGVYNLWQGLGVQPVEGDCTMALDFIRDDICSSNPDHFAYLIRWMAWCVQNPGKQAEVAVVTQGAKGAGKGTLWRWMLRIFGMHGLHILHRRHLVGNFNAHLRAVCFVFADEAFFAGDHDGEAVIKGVITEPELTVERKGVDAFAIRNRLKVAMATNSEWAVAASEDERRYFVLVVSSRRRGDHEFFHELNRQMDAGGLGALLHYLLNLDITDFNIRSVPNTQALQQQKIRSLKPFRAWLFARLWAGSLSSIDTEWRASQPRASICAEFAEYAKAKSLRYEATDARALGVELHAIFPGLADKREAAGRRAWLWVFPELTEAREAFCRAAGLEHIQWPEA
ncbi:MAG: hypothetical protein RJA63_460 [Pseudomonadota bacterium]